MELASAIAENTAKFDQYLFSHNLSTPSFEPNVLLRYDLPVDIARARQAVLEATDELSHLMMGPVDVLTSNAVCLLVASLFWAQGMANLHSSCSGTIHYSVFKLSIGSTLLQAFLLVRRRLHTMKLPKFAG